jgi:hypothetical protein
VIARHEAGGGAPLRVPRERNYDMVAALVAERVARTIRTPPQGAGKLRTPRGSLGITPTVPGRTMRGQGVNVVNFDALRQD